MTDDEKIAEFLKTKGAEQCPTRHAQRLSVPVLSPEEEEELDERGAERRAQEAFERRLKETQGGWERY